VLELPGRDTSAVLLSHLQVAMLRTGAGVTCRDRRHLIVAICEVYREHRKPLASVLLFLHHCLMMLSSSLVVLSGGGAQDLKSAFVEFQREGLTPRSFRSFVMLQLVLRS
jgi:hypothetical protein